MNQKGFTTPILLLIILLLIAGIAYFIYNKSLDSTTPILSLQNAKNDSSPTPNLKLQPPVTTATSSAAIQASTVWSITMNSPTVEILVTDSSGKSTGYKATSKQYVDELPDSSYGIQPGIGSDINPQEVGPDVLSWNESNPQNGTYTLQVMGTKDAPYELHLSWISSEPKPKILLKTIRGTAKINSADYYQIDIPSLSVVKKLD